MYLAIHRSTNGGASSYICQGITEALPNEGNTTYCGASDIRAANFIAPFILDPNDRNRLLAGAASLWVTDSARTTVVVALDQGAERRGRELHQRDRRARGQRQRDLGRPQQRRALPLAERPQQLAHLDTRGDRQPAPGARPNGAGDPAGPVIASPPRRWPCRPRPTTATPSRPETGSC